MGKQDVVAEQLKKIQDAQVQAVVDGLGASYDAGVADQVPVVSGGFSQDDVDAAVAAAVAQAKVDSDQALADQKAADDLALSDAQSKAESDLAGLQVALDDMTKKEQLEEGAVKQLQASVDSVQAAFDGIKAILFPSPVPVPQPKPEPAPAPEPDPAA